MSETFIVVGAGQAGLQICDSVRKEGYTGQLLLVGDEELAPYQRPPLSKQFLEGELDVDRLPFRPPNFFEKKDITLMLGEAVGRIDVNKKTILIGTREINFHKLAIATGTRVRKLPIPGGELEGVHYLRTVADANGIKDALQNAKSLVAIGGGFIGLEIAAVARKMGLAVSVIEAQGRLMERAVSPTISEYFSKVHSDAGVNVLLNSAVSAIGKREDGFVITLADGQEIKTDMCVAGIGAVPNVEIAEAAGVECNNGIVVDCFGRTSLEDVFAAGDCTMHENAKLKVRHRLESVQNAVDQAKTVAAIMMGLEKPYEQIPWFWSDQYDKKLQMVGRSKDADEEVLRGQPGEHSFSVFYFKEGNLIGVESVNQAKDHMLGRKMLNNDIHLTTTQAADETLDLKTLTS